MNFYIKNILFLLFFSFSFLVAKLIEVVKLDPTIKLDIRYATKNNFTGKKVYFSTRCYLEEEAAHALLNVQKELRKEGLGLKIFDGYRPLSVQKKFWEICPDPRYIASPYKGSMHNRGIAVDLTLINLKTEKEIKMPSEFDNFSEKAHRNYKQMQPEVQNNCKKLENIMMKYGFLPFSKEWWHFNWKEWNKFAILDITFEELEKTNSN